MKQAEEVYYRTMVDLICMLSQDHRMANARSRERGQGSALIASAHTSGCRPLSSANGFVVVCSGLFSLSSPLSGGSEPIVMPCGHRNPASRGIRSRPNIIRGSRVLVSRDEQTACETARPDLVIMTEIAALGNHNVRDRWKPECHLFEQMEGSFLGLELLSDSAVTMRYTRTKRSFCQTEWSRYILR
jgi:hypothetical protein